MYELIQVSEKCYYVASPAKVGIVKTGDGEVCLIDSGSDKDAAKKIRKILDANGWRLSAIYNTHSHADHIGGNKYLQDETGCKIYASGIECDFTRHPILEPSHLFAGNPPKELRHKFLLANESFCEPLTADKLPSGMEILSLPGHSFDMVGFRVDDGTVFLADALSSKETLSKYGVGYVYDIGAYLDTLEKIKAMTAKMFVPSHAAETSDITSLAEYNIKKAYEVADTISEICQSPVAFDALLQRLFKAYGLTMSFQQYALVGSTVRSYLVWLTEKGRMASRIEDEMILWESVK